jgi:hypothetical protein
VGTGLEARVARDSRAVICSESTGKVASVTASQIVITKDGSLPEGKKKIKDDHENGVYVYELRKFMRSNASTCINQKVIVKKGQSIKKGDVIADGPNTEKGELALGRNVLVAFMPWNGYNFEDAILISKRVVKEDIYTSIHIDEFEIDRFDPAFAARAVPRGSAGTEYTLAFVRVEPFVVPKKSLTGDNSERVDTRVLQVIYDCSPERDGPPGQGKRLFVGTQVDVFIEADDRAGREGGQDEVRGQGDEESPTGKNGGH